MEVFFSFLVVHKLMMCFIIDGILDSMKYSFYDIYQLSFSSGGNRG